jgi:predicted DNA-binding transcriptional regulator YafY
VNLGRRWYVAAWDRRRGAWRSFRVDRIDRPAPSGMRFEARAIPGGDAAAYVEQSIAGAFSRLEARVTVHASAEAVAARLPHLAGALTPIDDGRCECRMADEDPEWLALRVAMLGFDVEVNDPPELVTHLRALAERLRRASAPR